MKRYLLAAAVLASFGIGSTAEAGLFDWLCCWCHDDECEEYYEYDCCAPCGYPIECGYPMECGHGYGMPMYGGGHYGGYEPYSPMPYGSPYGTPQARPTYSAPMQYGTPIQPQPDVDVEVESDGDIDIEPQSFARPMHRSAFRSPPPAPAVGYGRTW